MQTLDKISRMKSLLGVCIIFFLLSACRQTTPVPIGRPTDKPSEVRLTATPIPPNESGAENEGSTEFLPTLGEAEVEIVREQLQGAECINICLWGTTPGFTKIQEIDSLLEKFRPYGRVFTRLQSTSMEFDFGNELVFLQLDHRANDAGITTMVHGTSRSFLKLVDPRQSPNLALYNYLLAPWTMQNVLQKFGNPEQVAMSLVTSYAEPPYSGRFNTWFIYPAEGLILRYEASVALRSEMGNIRGFEQDIAMICPDISFIEIWLLADKSDLSINKQLEEATLYWNNYQNLPNGYKSVPQVLNRSLDSFLNDAREGRVDCFETAPRLWATSN